jgi:multidrug efflux system outer membrane protein
VIATAFLTLVALGEAPVLPAPGPGLPTLSLEAALHAARQDSLELEVARARLGQAETLARKAWSYYLPQLTVGGSATRNSDEAILDLPTATAIRNLGTPTSLPGTYDPARPFSPTNLPGAPTTYVWIPTESKRFELQKTDQYAAQAQLTQALVAPAVIPAIHNAYTARAVATAEVEAARRDVLFGAAQLYYAAVGYREAVAVQERVLETYRQHERDAGERVAQGLVTRLASLRAATDRARAEQDLVRTRNAYASARLALATLLDRAPDFEVAEPPEPELPAASAELHEQLLVARPDLRAAAARLELARGQHTGVAARYLPSLGLSAMYRWANITGFTGENTAWAVTLGVSWTIFDGGLREAELSETDEKVAEARAARKLAENRARDELERALLDRESALAARAKATEQARLAHETLELAQRNFNAGVATSIDVSDATSAVLGAELSVVNESLAAQLAALRVEKAAGSFDPR